MHRLHPDNLRAAWWAFRAAHGTRRRLAADGLDVALAVPPPPPLPAEAERGVRAALRRRGEKCLVSAIVRQAWETAHGRRRDLIIGVSGAPEFRAHAWLEGDSVPSPESADALDLGSVELEQVHLGPISELGGDDATGAAPGFHELVRRPARPASRAA